MLSVVVLCLTKQNKKRVEMRKYSSSMMKEQLRETLSKKFVSSPVKTCRFFCLTSAIISLSFYSFFFSDDVKPNVLNHSYWHENAECSPRCSEIFVVAAMATRFLQTEWIPSTDTWKHSIVFFNKKRSGSHSPPFILQQTLAQSSLLTMSWQRHCECLFLLSTRTSVLLTKAEDSFMLVAVDVKRKPVCSI